MSTTTVPVLEPILFNFRVSPDKDALFYSEIQMLEEITGLHTRKALVAYVFHQYAEQCKKLAEEVNKKTPASTPSEPTL